MAALLAETRRYLVPALGFAAIAGGVRDLGGGARALLIYVRASNPVPLTVYFVVGIALTIVGVGSVAIGYRAVRHPTVVALSMLSIMITVLLWQIVTSAAFLVLHPRISLDAPVGGVPAFLLFEFITFVGAYIPFRALRAWLAEHRRRQREVTVSVGAARLLASTHGRGISAVTERPTVTLSVSLGGLILRGEVQGAASLTRSLVALRGRFESAGAHRIVETGPESFQFKRKWFGITMSVLNVVNSGDVHVDYSETRPFIVIRMSFLQWLIGAVVFTTFAVSQGYPLGFMVLLVGFVTVFNIVYGYFVLRRVLADAIEYQGARAA